MTMLSILGGLNAVLRAFQRLERGGSLPQPEEFQKLQFWLNTDGEPPESILQFLVYLSRGVRSLMELWAKLLPDAVRRPLECIESSF